MSDLPEFVVERSFDAPRELVWRAWTEPELLSRWYGPGAETIVHKFDLEPGGLWLNEMKWGDNSNFQKVVFKEVSPPERLVWNHHSSVDSDWNDAANPMMADWPKLLLTTVTFEQVENKTHLRLLQIPLQATDAEIACFAEVMGKMSGGWGAGFSIIDDILTEL
ncbi:MAG: SRPBCC domain-containing protein [Gammaproteobacteria bacterium]|nr:SRPBCC domain-containing protein [Gammaproteobacteria bacterium]